MTTNAVLDPGATAAAGAVLRVKSLPFAPSKLTLLIVNAEAPLLRTVKVFDTPTPGAVLPKPRVPIPLISPVPAGCSTAMDGRLATEPVPVRVTLNGLCTGSLLGMCSTAVRSPTPPGEKFTIKVVLPAGVTGERG